MGFPQPIMKVKVIELLNLKDQTGKTWWFRSTLSPITHSFQIQIHHVPEALRISATIKASKKQMFIQLGVKGNFL